MDVRLAAAVRAGDAEEVRTLVDAGADPNGLDETGLPLLCSAVAAYDAPVAEALIDGGADPDRALPDGTTPLLRAVDLGSPAMVTAVLGRDPAVRLDRAARERLLALARSWYTGGAEEELRRRTGATGPAETVRTKDDEYLSVDQVSLGGLVVRAGHGAVLTSLEWAFRVLTPVEELVDRGVRYADDDHVDWWEASYTLSRRSSQETWSAVMSLRHRPDTVRRLFAASVLWSAAVGSEGSAHEQERSEVCAAWAAEETDGAVLAKVLDAWGCFDHPGQPAMALRHAGHPDRRVREQVPWLLSTDGTSFTADAQAALLALAHDGQAEVRAAACTVLGSPRHFTPVSREALVSAARDPYLVVRSAAAVALAQAPDHSTVVTDVLVTLLDDDDTLVRLEAAYGLARRDHPLTGQALEKVGPLEAAFDIDHRLIAVRDWKWRNEARTD
ncbi:HEAT repeat domain-containing protein [Streptomyces sp. NPDC002004]